MTDIKMWKTEEINKSENIKEDFWCINGTLICFTYVRRNVSSFVQRVAVMMLVTRFKILATWCTWQCSHSNWYPWWAISSSCPCTWLCFFKSLQLHLVMVYPQVWWLDIRFSRFPLDIAFHVPGITTNRLKDFNILLWKLPQIWIWRMV